MRIALLSHASRADSVAGDGIAPGVLVHARALIELGHTVEVFASARRSADGTGRIRPAVLVNGVPCSFFARGGALRRALVGDGGFGMVRVAQSLSSASDALAGLRRSLHDGGFDVVEVVGDGAAAGLVGLCDGLRAIVRLHGIWPADGTAAERLGAARLARIGMAAAGAVSVPSSWLRGQLLQRRVVDGAFVVPDAVELPEAAMHSAADGARLFVWCEGGESAADEVTSVVAALAAARLDLQVSVAGSRAGNRILADLQANSDVVDRLTRVSTGDPARALPDEPSIGLFWFDRAPACPAVLLTAMAAGMPLAVRAVGAVTEAVRDEIDALLFADGESARVKLERIMGAASLRARLSRAARQRAATRFDPIACARRRLQIYEFVAVGRAGRIASPPTEATTVLLGPENWFEAWWLSSRERRPTVLRRDVAGRIALLDLGYDELKVVEAVLVRSWCDGPKDWSAAEWVELRALQAQMLDHFDALRGRQEVAPDESAVALVLPPRDHPMFAPDQPGFLLREVWRLQGHAGYTAWLAAAVEPRAFAASARENVHLRQIAVEAARRIPGSEVFDVLRRVYRDKKWHDAVVADDREFLARDQGGDAFARGIAELGLHMPLPATRFPVARRRRRPPPETTAPRITVVIPSYRHEAYVRLAIESCLRQTITDVQVLVADDRSPDGTVAAAEAVQDPRLSVQVNAANVGLGASVLAALERVDTPYVALLNSDDLFHPERLAKCLEVFENDSGADLVATGFAVVDSKGVVLTHATSCAAEIGPKAHGWLRWFEEIARDELRQPQDWVTFEVLLRHNVLATSSNMVFRTDWLRKHMPEASRLKYCLDWQLFLQAAMEGSLRMVEGPLLAYRLHSANTVWFTEGGRADYVFEVNRVVDRVLGQWLERAVERDGAASAVERLATLLEHDVRSHGEADGLALYLSDLVSRYAADALDPEAAPLAALAEAALQRNAYARVIKDLDVEPWSLPWRVRTADRWRLEHDVADGYGARARSLDTECARLRLELGSSHGEAEDLRALRQRAEVELQNARRRAEEERAALREAAEVAAARARADFEAARDRYETALHEEADRRVEEVSRLRASVDEQAGQLADRDRELLDRGRELAEHGRELAARDRELADRGRELQEARGALDAATRSIARVRSDLQSREAEIVALRAERDQAREDLRLQARLRDRAIGSVLAVRAELAARLASPSWHLGEYVMRPIGVLGAYKTLGTWARRAGMMTRRGWWHLRRSSTAVGRARGGVMVFADGRDTSMIDERVLRWLRSEDGEPRRLVGWSRSVGRETARDVGQGLWLADDARLEAADRAYFLRRNAAGTAALEQLFSATPWLGRAWRGARIAKTTGTGLAIAQGLRCGAVMAFAAKALCGVRFVLVLGDEDLVDLQVGREVAGAILRAADLLVVDTDLVSRAAEQLAGSLPNRTLVRWAIEPDTRARAAASTTHPGSLRAFVQWPASMRADPETLVTGVGQAVAAGCDLTVDVVGGGGGDASALHRWLLLEDRIDAAGLASRFRLHGDVAPTMRRRLLESCDVGLWVGRSVQGAGLPDLVVEGLATGTPLIVSAVPELTWVPALAECSCLIEPGDAAMLASALRAFASDPESFGRRTATGLALMAEHARGDPGLLGFWSPK